MKWSKRWEIPAIIYLLNHGLNPRSLLFQFFSAKLHAMDKRLATSTYWNGCSDSMTYYYSCTNMSLRTSVGSILFFQ
ncbi:hypothetical protein Y1Q_0024710 [Alligator mississippiensis]|uniref:Uncharacterized protein n=1 Tax=Alligator mississippiensis TaxID=8496 RepID=A0A151PH60_ALLMI|nr:hypothetical protein Y1Q_0024710 [Alligator mississippiensis]